ncbi:MAG TPA: NUDIX domain-containing protein [Ramlibacter sp.]|uniref:NUDIX domain-containing protein n=1 Tax=Ramlibacter sp. TaxID=1917967 RepID=UPI002D446DE6|nr:NUDIX domain-containing protein [Ramlibacter sp.]HZY17901.1 NUDIX domain-containing protein [Ramlibacter sp.]
MSDRPALAVCTARFLLPGTAQLALVRAALARAPRCAVFIRRAHMAPSPASPFAWEERARMLLAALAPAERERVEVLPLRERWDDHRLLRDMALHTSGAQRVAWLVAGAPPLDEQDLPAGWTLETIGPEDGDALAATWLEQLYASADPVRALPAASQHLPADARAFLRDWADSERFAIVRDDWRQIATEKRAWSVAPYPVVLVTVDALVRAGGHVLLVRRGRSPGKGLWAVPGGFLEPREPVLQAALRELVEETGLPLSRREMQQRLRRVHIFDHPERSQRGRIVTHAFFFELGDAEPPPVQGGDDAAAAQWVPQAQLTSLEAQLHDDHFHILDTFLGLSGPS